LLNFEGNKVDIAGTETDGLCVSGSIHKPANHRRAEPLPWSDLFVKRGRSLARALQGIDEDIRVELTSIRSSLERAGFKPFLPLVNAALDK
jgi:hypothetical protein